MCGVCEFVCVRVWCGVCVSVCMCVCVCVVPAAKLQSSGAVACPITEHEAMRKSPQGFPDPTLPWATSVGGATSLVYGSRVDAEHRRLQASRGVVEVRLLDPQQRHPILPL